MRKYGACLAALAAVTLMGPTAVAAAHTLHQKHATQVKKSFIVIGRHHQRVSLYVQRSHRRAGARAAACPAGNFNPSYCSPPVQQNLFGAYAWNYGSATFGSNSSNTCKALGWSSAPCGVYTSVPNTLIAAFVGASGPSGAQSITVSCKTASGGACPVTFHKVNSENGGGGDSEVWYADATSVISQTAPIFVTATAAQVVLRLQKQERLRRQPSGRHVHECDHGWGDGSAGDRDRSFERVLLDERRTDLLAHDDGAG